MKKIIFAVCALLAAFSAQCLAEVRVSYDTTAPQIKINVTGIEKQPALISVTEGKYDAEKSPSERKYVFVKELYSDGKLECEIPADAPSGEYTVITAVDGELNTQSVWHINAALAEDALKRLAAAKTADEVAVIIDAEYEKLAVDPEEFSAYKQSTSKNFLALFAGTKKTAADFRSVYGSALAIAKASADSADAEKYARSYASELGLDLDEFDALPEATKTEFLRLFASGTVNQNTPEKQTAEFMFLAKFNTEKSWTVCRDLIMVEYKDFLGIDATKYNKLSNGENVIKKLMNKTPYSSVTALVSDFNAAVDSGSGSGSTGGGGSSGGSSGGVSAGGYVDTAVSRTVGVFDDVPEGHWAYSYVKDLCARGVIKGVDEKHFCPQNGITRAEFATLLRAMFYKSVPAGGAELADVHAGDWYYEPICVLNASGIMFGDENGFFNPNSQITRQDVCVMLQRILSLPAGKADFADGDAISGYAAEAVGSLYQSGIVSGRGDNLFAPQDTMTRAEAAAILCRASERSRG